MSKPRYDPSGNPADRNMARDHSAGRARTAASPGGYRSGPQFGDAVPGRSAKTLDDHYAEDFARLSDTDLRAAYDRASAATTQALGSDKFMDLMREETRLRKAMVERGLSIF